MQVLVPRVKVSLPYQQGHWTVQTWVECGRLMFSSKTVGGLLSTKEVENIDHSGSVSEAEG